MITDKIIIYRKVIDALYPLYMKKYHETELDESEITIIMCSLKIRISNLDSIQFNDYILREIVNDEIENTQKIINKLSLIERG